jgi:hypothetical protein
MPPVNIPSSDYLAQQINLMQQQIQALQTQQQYVMVDKNGILRVQLGLLQTGDYGLYLEDPSGNRQEILPAANAYYNPALTLSGFGPSTISGSPQVQCTIGASGNAKITIGSFIELPSAGGNNCYGGIFLVIDGGGTLYGQCQLTASLGASQVASASVTQIYSLTGLLNGGTLSPGLHTFSLKYYSNNSGGYTFFAQNFLEVVPV